MTFRTNVSPTLLPIRRRNSAIEISYLDGRVVTYNGPFSTDDASVESTRSVEIHVLIVNEEFSEGMIVYVNDYDTVDAILESTGVGRILLDDEDRELLYPGVEASRQGERIVISAESAPSDTWVYVFVESQLAEEAHQLASPHDVDM